MKKDKVIKIIKEYAPLFIYSMKLPKNTVITVTSMKELRNKKIQRTDVRGLSQMDDKYNDIFIVYNFHKNKKDVLLTLIHELLHVKLHPLVSMVSKRKLKSANGKEETIVQHLESFMENFL